MPSSSLTRRERLEYRTARALAALPPRAQVRLSGRPAIAIDGQRLDPEIQMTLALLERRGDPPIETLGAPDARRVTRRQAEIFGGIPVEVGEVRDLTVDGAAGPLGARLYSPAEPATRPLALLVYLHGGGFVIGDLDVYENTCRLLCRHAGVHVLSVDYRLAPEHRFPAAVDDAHAAFRWAAAHAEELGADPRRVAVGGDSAGGNLAAVVAQMARDDGGPAPALQLLIYPTTDQTRRHPSYAAFGQGFFLTADQMEWFGEQYAPREHFDLADPRISPLAAEDLSGLAPAYVVTAAFDPLRDEGEAYAHALRAAGVPAPLRRFPGLIHGFVNMVGTSRVSREALVEVAGATRAMLGAL